MSRKTKAKRVSVEENLFIILVVFSVLFLVLFVLNLLVIVPKIKNLDSQLLDCQREFPNCYNHSLSFWIESNNYICIGDFYINGDLIDIKPFREIGYWNRTVPNLGEKRT